MHRFAAEDGQVSIEMALMVLVGLGLCSALAFGLTGGFGNLVTKITGLL